MPLYSETTTDHFRRPRNVGILWQPTAEGRASDGDNTIWMYLRLERGRVAGASFRALACSSCVAAASLTTLLAWGRPLPAARQITAARLLLALDGLPPERAGCADLAATALQRALDVARG